MIQTTDKPFRVIRGGSWFDAVLAGVRAAHRYASTPSNRSYSVGFRCALRVRQPVGKVRL